MAELGLIFLGGFLGSSHCLGMCGGFAVILGLNKSTVRQATAAQLIYSCGRIFSYTILGSIAGVAGQRISLSANQWVNASALLSLLAGLFLIYQGLKAAGISLWRRSAKVNSQSCLMGSVFQTFLQSPAWTSKFLAGVLTGFLPCGLLYAFLALAAASQDLVTGGAIMFAFGLGTVPLMVIAGLGGRLLSFMMRQRLLKIAAWSVVVTGLVTTYRGIGAISSGSREVLQPCPFCTSISQSFYEQDSSQTL